MQRNSKGGESGHESSAEYLKAAQPHLILRVVPITESAFKIAARINKLGHGRDEVIEEGFDPSLPLGPLYWRIVKRGDHRFYCSTFQAGRDEIVRAWGKRGLAYCDPVTRTAVARIETRLLIAQADAVPIHELGARGEMACCRWLRPWVLAHIIDTLSSLAQPDRRRAH